MNELEKNEIYKRLCDYQSYLRFVLIKKAANSPESKQFSEMCLKIEKYYKELLDGLEDTFIKRVRQYPNLSNSCLKDILSLADATANLHSEMQKFIGCCFPGGSVIRNYDPLDLVEKQKLFTKAKEEYQLKTGRDLSGGIVSVLKEFAYCQAKEKENVINVLFNGIKDYFASNSSVAPDEVIRNMAVEVDNLPESIVIGSTVNSFKVTTDDLIDRDIDDIISGCQKKNLSLDIRKNGNLIINAEHGSERDDVLYDYICNLALRFYDSFPIGALRVHFIDSLKDPKFAKFISGFQRGNTSEKNRVAVDVSENYSEIIAALDNRCDDLLLSKLVGETKDMYDLFSLDSNEYFELVVIRNGFEEIAKSGSRNYFQKLISGIDPTLGSHRCGIRYIIVNDLKMDDPRIDENVKNKMVGLLNSDSVTVIDYSHGVFKNKNETIKPLSIEPGFEEERFIESKCAKMGEVLRKKAGQIITYEELGCFESCEKLDSSIVSIPIGKSGSDIVSIPFSCADTDNSDEAKNIGLMVLGQSGSGKSSLYHSIVINGGLKYSPSDLQFWLLDFKENASVGLYSSTNNDIPHIKIVAPNSKKNDAYNILRMLVGELEYRLQLFNDIGKEYGKAPSNVLEYNRMVEGLNIGKYKKMPRIILMIDEAQELFRSDTDGANDDLSKDIGVYINKLVSLGRSSGIHMAIFAQNLDGGKTYILKENFINQLRCKVCFRLSSGSVANSGFKGEFDNRKDEIESLGTGEIYLAYSDSRMEKCRVAYVSGSKLIDHLGKIIQKYKDFKSDVLKIGLTNQLSGMDAVSYSKEKYIEKILSAKIKDDKIACVVGEDAYSLRPINVVFNPLKISSVFLVGNSRGIAMSLFASLFIGLSKIGCDIRICNGMRREKSLYKNLIDANSQPIINYPLIDIDKCVEDLYVEYRKRKQSEETTGEYDTRPIVLFLNDFDAQEKIQKNIEILKNESKGEHTELKSLGAIMQKNLDHNNQNSFQQSSSIQLKSAIGELLKNAYQYSIYLVILLKDVFYREFDDSIKSSPNVIIFNETQYQGVVDNYLIRGLLKDIRQTKPVRSVNDYEEDDETQTDNESFAIVRRNKDDYIKFRPVVYNVKNEDEINEILSIVQKTDFGPSSNSVENQSENESYHDAEIMS